jgi:hypothetical protein
MITQLLNKIKKLINLFLFYCMKFVFWKHWVLLGARPNADGSCSQQEPRLMGPAVVRPKAILDLSRDKTQLKWVLLGKTQFNIFSLGLIA